LKISILVIVWKVYSLHSGIERTLIHPEFTRTWKVLACHGD
jgi:hypothetical protein